MKSKKFYGNSLLGTWTVPSTGKRIIPQLSNGKQRMIWGGRPSIDAFGGYEWDEVDGIEWLVDGWSKEMKNGEPVTCILMPWYNGEKLEYDEAM